MASIFDQARDILKNLTTGTNNPMTSPQPAMAPLKTQGNQIVRSDTNEPVQLKGVVSDFFRGMQFSKAHDDINNLIKRVDTMKQHGSNSIVLYLSDPKFLQGKEKELDSIVNYAKDNGMYVTLMPVARDFSESNDVKVKDNNLSNLLDQLSTRYKDYPNVMYGTGAEQEKLDWPTWKKRQEDLASYVRRNSPNAPIVGTANNSYVFNDVVKNPLSVPNTIYMGGGYSAKNDSELAYKVNQENPINSRDQINAEKQLPIYYGEFGGNYGDNFSSPSDLQQTQDMINSLKARKASYGAYRIDNTNSGLDLLDKNNNLTPKGKMFADSFKPTMNQTMQPEAYRPLLMQSAQGFLKKIAYQK